MRFDRIVSRPTIHAVQSLELLEAVRTLLPSGAPGGVSSSRVEITISCDAKIDKTDAPCRDCRQRSSSAVESGICSFSAGRHEREPQRARLLVETQRRVIAIDRSTRTHIVHKWSPPPRSSFVTARLSGSIDTRHPLHERLCEMRHLIVPTVSRRVPPSPDAQTAPRFSSRLRPPAHSIIGEPQMTQPGGRSIARGKSVPVPADAIAPHQVCTSEGNTGRDVAKYAVPSTLDTERRPDSSRSRTLASISERHMSGTD